MLPTIGIGKLWERLKPAKQQITHWGRAFRAKCDALIPFGQPTGQKSRPSRKDKCCNPIPDGCTGVPNFDFKEVCDLHDLHYAAGGSASDRRRADEALRQGILARGHPILARVYFIGVRVLGRRAFCFHKEGFPLCEANAAETLIAQNQAKQMG